MFSHDPMSYFPGDPPWSELAILLGIGLEMVVGLFLAAIWFAGRNWLFFRVARSALLTVGGVCLVAILGGSIGIASRHIGPWMRLQLQLQHAVAMVDSEVKAGKDVQSIDLPSDLASFQFDGTERPVTLRVMRTVWPYVGVDFGRGANTVFHPTTMVCIYSD